MVYNFVKIKGTRLKNHVSNWMLECDSVEKLFIHNKKYYGSNVELEFTKYLNAKDGGEDSNWVKAAKMLSGNDSIVVGAVTLEMKGLEGKVKAIENYGRIYLSDRGSYMIMSSTDEIVDECTMDECAYPKKSKGDIRVFQWIKGRHYYAKIDKMDVVDGEGNQKWYTRKEAQDAADKYLKEIYYKV